MPTYNGGHHEEPRFLQESLELVGEQQMPAATQAAPIQFELVATQVAEVLRHWIMTGRLAAGRHIKQEAIARELGVSRVPVREAFVVLEAEGIIVREKYKGAFVAGISLAEVKETYVLRDLLEVFLFGKALPHITEDHLRRAEEIIRQSDKAEMGRGWARLNRDFHMTLYEPAQLPLTLQTFESMLNRTDRYFRLQQAVSTTLREDSRAQHQAIVDTIRSGDHKAALHALQQHIKNNADEVVGYLESQSPVGAVAAPSAQDSDWTK